MFLNLFRRDNDLRLRQSLAALSGGGLAIMMYLTWVHYSTASTFCNFAKGFSCDLVNQSLYAEFFGIPIAILGGLFFAAALALLFTEFFPDPYRPLVVLLAFGLPFSLALSLVEIIDIKSICVYCELSKILMIGVFIGAMLGCRKHKVYPHWTFILAALGASFLATTLAIWQAQV